MSVVLGTVLTIRYKDGKAFHVPGSCVSSIGDDNYLHMAPWNPQLAVLLAGAAEKLPKNPSFANSRNLARLKYLRNLAAGLVAPESSPSAADELFDSQSDEQSRKKQKLTRVAAETVTFVINNTEVRCKNPASLDSYLAVVMEEKALSAVFDYIVDGGFSFEKAAKRSYLKDGLRGKAQ